MSAADVRRFARQWNRALLASYDAAQTTDENRRHWANADDLSAAAANSPEVRRIIRGRARYEAANNCYAKGIVRSIAHTVVGRGPRLQLKGVDRAMAIRIERSWSDWSKAVRLARKLRTMQKAKIVDGEAFAMLVTNPLVRSPILLDVRLVESDQVAADHTSSAILALTDGIELDDVGNPVSYALLREHPGTGLSMIRRTERVDAENMIHVFQHDRAGQYRGVSELTPALPLFALLRRFTLATVFAAETAAAHAGVLQSDAPAADDGDDVEPMDTFEFERNMFTSLPMGWKLAQLKAEHPSTTYPMFKRELINEVARSLSVPYNIAAGNSSGYNYSSGRLDHQEFDLRLREERDDAEIEVVDRIFDSWIREAVKLGIAPAAFADAMRVQHSWHWDGRKHVDPAKEANAQAIRLANNTTTLAAEYAEDGKDWEQELAQRAEEIELQRRLGILPAAMATVAPDEDDPEDDEPATDDAEMAEAAIAA